MDNSGWRPGKRTAAELEDVHHGPSGSDSGSDEDEFAWESLDLTQVASADDNDGPAKSEQGLTIELTSRRDELQGQQKSRLHLRIERKVRLETHKLHLLCLMAHCGILNHMTTRTSLQRKLQPLVDAFDGNVHPKPTSAAIQRTRVLQEGLRAASTYFANLYDICSQGLTKALWMEPDDLAKLSAKSYEDRAVTYTDVLECAGRMEGNRDIGAVLFVAFLRMLKLEVRLVCSLQPLSLRVNKQTSAEIVAVSEKRVAVTSPISVIRPPVSATPVSARGGSRSLSRPRLGAVNHAPPNRTTTPPSAAYRPVRSAPESLHPVFWAEVFDVAAGTWYPVDPLVTGTVNRPGQLEPPMSDTSNVLSYVVAMARDGSARDVTRRYARQYAGKTLRLRLDSVSAEQEAWWSRAILRKLYRVPRRLRSQETADRDAIEDAELSRRELSEPAPVKVDDFRHHPHFVLARHLRHDEALSEGARECGRLTIAATKTQEPYYPRKAVIKLRSSWGWYLRGRQILPAAHPLKHALRNTKSDESTADPLFAIHQTTPIEPRSLGDDGEIPVGEFGTVDLFHQSLLPLGCSHLQDIDAEMIIPSALVNRWLGMTSGRRKMIKYVCEDVLGVSYAPAVTSIAREAGSRGRGRYRPVVEGVVVASAHADAVGAVWERCMAAIAAHAKRQALYTATDRWRKVAIALRIKHTVESRYGDLTATRDTVGGGFIQ
ncbi:hypothetical protein PYCC9005_003632 [Savitreella phatthalungensis]